MKNIKSNEVQMIYNLIHLIEDELRIAREHFSQLNDLIEEKYEVKKKGKYRL